MDAMAPDADSFYSDLVTTALVTGMRLPGRICGGAGRREVTVSDNPDPLGSFEVGVEIVAAGENAAVAGDRGGQGSGRPGYDEASGRKLLGGRPDGRPAVVVKGEQAVRAATDAIAGQIGLAAERIATAIDMRTVAAAGPGQMGLDSVQVAFGITLTAGVQTLFTAQAGSSVQVTVTLSRRPPAAS